MSGVAVAIMANIMPEVHADSSLEMIEATLQQAHEAAISQRRNFEVSFLGTNEIKVERVELSGSLTTTSDNFLGNGVAYALVTGVPDTPDNFSGGPGAPGLADNFGNAEIVFASDGTAVDASGNVVNGTIFMAIGTNPTTARAVTVMGATGKVTGYSYNGSIPCPSGKVCWD